jgi:hypothetical protein
MFHLLDFILIIKMPMFKNCLNEVINSLNDLTNDQLKVLFGNTEKFKNWLENKEIEDIVSINLKYYE